MGIVSVILSVLFSSVITIIFNVRYIKGEKKRTQVEHEKAIAMLQAKLDSLTPTNSQCDD